MAKIRAKRGKAGARKAASRANRLNRGVDVLQNSVRRWSDYASETAHLAARGNLNPGAWVKIYSDMWQGLASDVGDLTKLVFAEGKKATRSKK
jgi:hypothetical protein